MISFLHKCYFFNLRSILQGKVVLLEKRNYSPCVLPVDLTFFFDCTFFADSKALKNIIKT